MYTVIYQIKDTIEDAKSLTEAGRIIREGGLVAFPTETVYGVGGDALNPASSRKIYAAKGRPSDNPLIVHIANTEDLEPITADIPEAGRKLADAFWPGPLTMIFRKSEKVPKETTGGLDTVAVRMPSDPVALAFIREAGGYVAAPSANLSGKPSPTSAKYVIQDMDGRIEMILDGGDVEIGLESTIVDLTEETPMMEKDTGVAPKAPGMKYRHYAPKGDLVIVEGDSACVVDYINEQTGLLEKQGEKVAVIGTEETKMLYHAEIVKSVGSRNREETIAHTLYRVLREFDDMDVTRIFSESFDTTGMGQAIMNRLLKAAGHKVIHLCRSTNSD